MFPIIAYLHIDKRCAACKPNTAPSTAAHQSVDQVVDRWRSAQRIKMQPPSTALESSSANNSGAKLHQVDGISSKQGVEAKSMESLNHITEDLRLR